MNHLEQFWDSVTKDEAALLATSAEGAVTMRTISPVRHGDGVLIFTSPQSQKYRQMKANPNCCMACGGCFMEATAEFLGHTMLGENAPLREEYAAKFHGAFDEGIEFGGRDAEFILLRPVKIKGWGFDNGVPTGPFEYSLS